MAGKLEDLKMVSEDVSPRGLAERSLNEVVWLVSRLEKQLRNAKIDERRLRAELGRLAGE